MDFRPHRNPHSELDSAGSDWPPLDWRVIPSCVISASLKGESRTCPAGVCPEKVTALPLSYLGARFSRWVGETRVLKSKEFPTEKIYVPTKRDRRWTKRRLGKLLRACCRRVRTRPLGAEP